MTGPSTRDVETADEAIAIVERDGGVHCMVTRHVYGRQRARWIMQEGDWIRISLKIGESKNPELVEEERPS